MRGEDDRSTPRLAVGVNRTAATRQRRAAKVGVRSARSGTPAVEAERLLAVCRGSSRRPLGRKGALWAPESQVALAPGAEAPATDTVSGRGNLLLEGLRAREPPRSMRWIPTPLHGYVPDPGFGRTRRCILPEKVRQRP